jgi:hypothetical protein
MAQVLPNTLLPLVFSATGTAAGSAGAATTAGAGAWAAGLGGVLSPQAVRNKTSAAMASALMGFCMKGLRSNGWKFWKPRPLKILSGWQGCSKTYI